MGRVDRDNVGVGVWGAHKREIGLTRVHDVIGVLPQTLEELVIFDARHGLTAAIFVS